MELMEKFELWHNTNPNVYELFKRFTLEVIRAGKRNSSAWLIANRIRWETSIVTTGNDFKISNDFIALYARKFMGDFPQYAGFFKTKAMKRV